MRECLVVLSGLFSLSLSPKSNGSHETPDFFHFLIFNCLLFSLPFACELFTFGGDKIIVLE